MRKITFSSEVHASLETIWKLLIERTEQPQTYLPGVVHSRILQHYGHGLLRELRGEGMLIREKVVIDKPHGEVNYFLLEHPLFSGRVTNRVVPSSVQSPVAPQTLTIEVDWVPKDVRAERLIREAIPEQIQREVLNLKERAELLDQDDTEPLTTPYAFGITISVSFADTLARVQQELQKEGFGIISEIDVKQKFKEKLHKEFRNYVILGACNPGLAYQAFGIDMNIGTLLPCNVVVYAVSDHRTAVMIMDPVAALAMTGNEQMTDLAETVKQAMQRVLEGVR